MTKRSFKVTAKKSIAILSSAALLMSYGTIGLISADAEEVKASASAAKEGAATKMYIYDEYGNDITDSPIVYIDNSSAAGQATSTRIKATIMNEDGELTDDIVYALPQVTEGEKSISTSAFYEYGENENEASVNINISGCGYQTVDATDFLTGEPISKVNEISYKPGKTTITIQSTSGEVRREVDVIVQEPAKDLIVYFNNSQFQMDLNDYNMYNSTPGTLAIANHPYQLTSSLITDHPGANPDYLDKVQWEVYEGESLNELVPTELAEISPDGLFTPKSNGVVTIVAYFKKTAKIDRNYSMAEKAFNREVDPITSMPNFASNPLTGERTDRPFAIGNKARNVYQLKVDEETFQPIYENGRLVYKTDDDGNRLYTTVTENYKAKRAHYYLDGNQALYADPYIGDNGKPVYEPLYTIPKYMKIYIAKENPATEIKFSKAPDIMQPGEISQLEINPTPTHNKNEPGYESGATDVWRWESSNPEVVSVDQTGVVTAHKKGDARIIVYGEMKRKNDLGVDEYISAETKITVLTKASSIQIDPSPTSTRVGVPIDLKAIMSPADANEEVEWEIVKDDKPEIAKIGRVENNEVISDDAQYTEELTNVQTARLYDITSTGTVEVIARTKNSKVEARCLVTVNQKNLSNEITLSYPDTEDSSKIIDLLDNGKCTIFTGQDITITGELKTYKGLDENGEPIYVTADDYIDWELVDNNDDFVTVLAQDGKSITFHGIAAAGEEAGVVHVKASSHGDSEINTKFDVVVKRCCDTVAIKGSNLEDIGGSKNMTVNSTLDLRADMRINGNHPYEHQDKVKSWTSSDETVASVSSSGEVKALKNGSASIKVTTASGKEASYGIYVFTTSDISLNGAEKQPDETLATTIQLNNELQGTRQLSATVRDDNNNVVGGSDCKWVSSNTNVATVSDQGLITAHDVGETTITVSSGTKSESCKLAVYAPITAAKFQEIEPYDYSPLMTSYEPRPTFTIGKDGNEHILGETTNYDIEYLNNTGVGMATMKLTGKTVYYGENDPRNSYYYGELVIPFEIKTRVLTDEAIKLGYIERQECTGAPVIPEINLTCQGALMTRDTDYRIEVVDNIKPGTATVRIFGINSYSDTRTTTFEIYCDHNTLRDTSVLKKETYTENGLIIGTCVACGETNVQKIIPMLQHTGNPATELSFERNEYGVQIGDALKLEPIIVTSDPTSPATDKFRWESDNPIIATVDDDGYVRGINKGITTITVYGENENVEASCEIGVITKAEEIKSAPNPLQTRVGVGMNVKSEIKPLECDDQIVWEVADPSIASVEASETDRLTATVTGISVGKTTVIARGKYSNISENIEVIVNPSIPSEIIAVSTNISDVPTLIPNNTATNVYTHKIFTNQNIVFDAVLTDKQGNKADDVAVWRITDNEGDTITLPDNPPNEDIVSDSVKIHAASLGTVTITVFPQSNPSLKTYFKLEVAKRCDNITIYDDKDRQTGSRSLNVDDTVTLHAVLTTNNPNAPLDHGDEIRDWKSTAPEIAEVDQNGKITAKRNGHADIILTTLSEQTRSVSINVFTTSNIYMISGVQPNPGDIPTAAIALNAQLEGTLGIGISVLNDEEVPVGDTICKWSSSDEKIATVSDTGIISGHNVGVVTITVESGAKSESCKLTVTAPVQAATYTPIDDYIYTPAKKQFEPKPEIRIGDNLLIRDADYDVEYINNTSVGTATMKITGNGLYIGEMVIPYQILPRSLSDSLVVVDPIIDQEYTGEPIVPEVHVTCDGVELQKDVDYTVKYDDNIEVGTAKITINPAFGSNYSESKTVEFGIAKTAPDVIGLYGDIDNDGFIKSGDALLILRQSVSLESFDDTQLLLADVDGDGKITANDALAVLRFSVGIIDGGVKVNTQLVK